MGRQLARESGVAADVVVPVPDSGVTAALGYAEEAASSVSLRPDPQSLRGPHIY